MSDSVSFEEWLRRVPESEILDYIGPVYSGMLRALGKSGFRAGSVRDALVEIRTPIELLQDKRFLQLFIETQPLNRVHWLYDRVFHKDCDDDAAGIKALLSRRGTTLEKIGEVFGLQSQPPVLPDSQLEEVGQVRGNYSLFPHQRAVVEKLRTFLPGKFGRNRVMVHMPTGSGKTRTSMRLIAEYLLENEGASVLWIANTSELCAQAADEFVKSWTFIGNREVGINRLWGGREFSLDERGGVVVASIQTLHSLRINPERSNPTFRRLSKRLAAIIFDEAHQAIASTYQDAVDLLLSMCPSSVSLVGLSATPGRTWDDVDADTELSEYFQSNKIKLQIEGYSSPVRFLIEEEYLANPIFQTFNYEGAIEVNGKALSLDKYDASPEVLKAVGESSARNLLILDRLADLVTRHQRIMYFAPSVENSNIIATLLNSRGIEASSVTGQCSPQVRRENICRYKEVDSTPKVLCNFGILTTGFDAPQTSAALIARPTQSLVLYSQMVGRAMRGPRAGGNKECEIHSIVDPSLPGFDHPIRAFDNWEDVWKQDS
jgi:DNA repair protein RadD